MAKNTVDQIDKDTGKQNNQRTTNIVDILLIVRAGCPRMADHPRNNIVHSYLPKKDLMINGTVATKANAITKLKT